MNIELYDFEKNLINIETQDMRRSLTDNEINKKYSEGEARIITEHGAIKLPLINKMFNTENYILQPNYQRRITWGNKKRSKLIESFIMNIPVPPVFLYETDFGVYQVMDGLQRISTIMDFFDNKFKLEGLIEWSELNGRYYNDLPKKVKEGIERRQLSAITLLKESAKTNEQAANMKKMVFERLNTGGETLLPQEVRNALYPGEFNNLCVKLSDNTNFKTLWKIDGKSNQSLYARMGDVELVLRFFAMRNIKNYNMQLSKFLDLYLENANKLKKKELVTLEKTFIDSMEKAVQLFGDKAFCRYTKYGNNWSWSAPQKMIFDPMMLAIESSNIDIKNNSIVKNIELLKSVYMIYEKEELFNGKKQSKIDIEKRTKVFITMLQDKI